MRGSAWRRQLLGRLPGLNVTVCEQRGLRSTGAPSSCYNYRVNRKETDHGHHPHRPHHPVHRHLCRWLPPQHLRPQPGSGHRLRPGSGFLVRQRPLPWPLPDRCDPCETLSFVNKGTPEPRCPPSSCYNYRVNRKETDHDHRHHRYRHPRLAHGQPRPQRVQQRHALLGTDHQQRKRAPAARAVQGGRHRLPLRLRFLGSCSRLGWPAPGR